MFTRKYRQMNADLQQQLAAERLHMAALDRSMARVEFDPDGNITDANENFLTLLGYRRDEILGKPHRQLCDGAYAQSEDYRRFWERLRRGEHFSGRCKRITREGRPLWLEATYNPVRDGQGRLLKVVKYASDIDAIVHQEHEMQSKLDALAGWRVSDHFTPGERAALAWAELVTDIAASHAEDEVYLPLREHFTPRQISDLTFAISLMNAFNRLAVAMRL